MNVLEIPFNRFVGLARSEADDDRLCLPSLERYTNHLGTVHASALFALAEAASGSFLLSEFSDLSSDAVPVVRRAEVKFRRPATGAVTAYASAPDALQEEFRSAFVSRGRALIRIDISVSDESGSLAMSASFEWFVTRREGRAAAARPIPPGELGKSSS